MQLICAFTYRASSASFNANPVTVFRLFRLLHDRIRRIAARFFKLGIQPVFFAFGWDDLFEPAVDVH